MFVQLAQSVQERTIPIDSLVDQLRTKSNEIIRAATDSMSRAADHSVLDATQRINAQLSLGWAPMNVFVAAMGILLAAGAIGSGWVLFNQSREQKLLLKAQRDEAKLTLDEARIEHTAAYEQMQDEYKQRLDQLQGDLKQFFAEAQVEMTRVHVEWIRSQSSAVADQPTSHADASEAPKSNVLYEMTAQLQDSIEQLGEPIVSKRSSQAYRRMLVASGVQRAVRAAYAERCAITGQIGLAVELTVRRVFRFSTAQLEVKDSVSNYILIRADLAKAYSDGKIAIDPELDRVLVAKTVQGSELEAYNGRVASLPSLAGARPNKKWLRMHLLLAGGREEFLPYPADTPEAPN